MQSTALRRSCYGSHQERFGSFLMPDMAPRSSQRFAASFCIDGKQFVNLSHNWGRNWISGI
jgi:hypothetical protein